MLGTIAGDHACIAAGNWNWPAQGIWLRVAAPARACVSPSALLEADTPQSAPGNFNVVRYDCQRLRRTPKSHAARTGAVAQGNRLENRPAGESIRVHHRHAIIVRV